ncbi:hypothetical protein DDZ14_03990 [Maritimibacter sp. 55A14]|uniref:periplasmic heavy metal sensor n=1 Tax=Maritimibacter sp. 55A14 TaxID=2174844 RepID=UPI000D6182E2|nr:periplasmic heavy metal sensor [Maritimibacter sp. 55A14]PWE33829.1 hypothetical protein DDZ14_03990 [Maritimibacter sp. 55A14]
MSAEEPKPAGAGRWVKIALVASLALNVAVLGLVAGTVFSPHHGKDRWRHHSDRGLMPMGLHVYGRAMPDADRQALIDAAREHGIRRQDAREELRGHFRDMVAALRADPFSAERVMVVLRAQHRSVGARIVEGQSLLVARISAMSPQARHAFADRLEDRLERYAARREDDR